MARSPERLWCTIDGCDRPLERLGRCKSHDKNGPDHIIFDKHSTLARDEQGNKRCCICKNWLSTDLFTAVRPGKSRDGLDTSCTSCSSRRKRANRFGVSDDWFDTTFAAQGNRCAICSGTEHRARGWAIDHDHSCCPTTAASCGKCVRAILCGPCNMGLGMFADNQERMLAAVSYLSAWDQIGRLR